MRAFGSHVSRTFPGESGYPDHEPVFEALSRLEQILAKVPGKAGTPPKTRLSEVLRREDGFELTPLGRHTFIGPQPARYRPGANVPLTVGAPLTRLSSF